MDYTLIAKILTEEGILTAAHLEAASREQKKSGEFLGTTIIKLGLAQPDALYGALSKRLGVPFEKIKSRQIDPAVIAQVPAKFASHYKIIPLEFSDGYLVLAVIDPTDVRQLDDIRLVLNQEIKPVFASEQDILEAMRAYYGVGAETLERMVAQQHHSSPVPVSAGAAQDVSTLAEDASIITFVNQILSEAVKDRASDIHLEPFQDELRTRFRIDGVLYDINIPDTIKLFHPAIVSRIKIMAQLNIAERRLPQDGRIKIKVDTQELDLRVSIMPTAFGEAVHIRILSTRFFLELEKLGLAKEDLQIIESAIKQPHGIIFVTGPTGSGKSTTLYAALAKINSSAVKIITIEDPVEYQLRGVNQVQVIPQIGFTFATALRHMLRHDPDVMMVGEVRDYETAEIAIRSALTGHLVFSTLHTNDAPGAVTRLLDMGIEPFLVSSSLECLIAQRLVRLICPYCKEKRKPSPEMLAQVNLIEKDGEVFDMYEGRGCEKCRFTGYRGRTAIYEILRLTEPVRAMVLERASSQQIKQHAIAQGMRTLRQDGLRKVREGLTTLTEVIRVTQQEELPED
jgi:type IV pilus assembly protein PilB